MVYSGKIVKKYTNFIFFWIVLLLNCIMSPPCPTLARFAAKSNVHIRDRAVLRDKLHKIAADGGWDNLQIVTDFDRTLTRLAGVR